MQLVVVFTETITYVAHHKNLRHTVHIKLFKALLPVYKAERAGILIYTTVFHDYLLQVCQEEFLMFAILLVFIEEILDLDYTGENHLIILIP